MEILISEQEKTVRTIPNIDAELFYSILECEFGFCRAQKVEIIEHDFYTHFIFRSYDQDEIDLFDNLNY